MASKGCFICHRKIDKFYVICTPDNKKYKVCGHCVNLARAFTKLEVKEDETVAPETTD